MHHLMCTTPSQQHYYYTLYLSPPQHTRGVNDYTDKSQLLDTMLHLKLTNYRDLHDIVTAWTEHPHFHRYDGRHRP